MLRSLYDWVIRLAGHPRAIPLLGVISFLESSVFPIPPDVMLVPMVLANRDKAFRIALVCTVCSVLGGLLGYAIGYYFFETIGDWVVKTYGLQSGLAAFRAGFEQYGIWIILIKGLTPIPYKLVTIASGAAHFDLFTFVWASIVTRGIRFFAVAALLWKFGEPIRAFIGKRLTLVTWLFLIALGSGALLGGAYYFQYVMGMAPCDLCYLQRWPHMVAIAAGLAALASFAWPRLALVLVLTAITALLVTAAIGVFHVGVEYHWWQGPQACSGNVPRGLSPEQLKKYLFGAKMVRCDETAWAMWGISMAGWNAILSAGLAFVLASGVARWVRWRT